MRLLFKIAGLIIILTTCTAIGFLKAISLKKRCKRLTEIINGFLKLKEKLRLRAGDKKRLLCECFGNQHNLTEGLKKEDITLFNDFLNTFGSGDTHSELQRCEAFIGLFDIKIDEATAELNSQAQLYKGLGFLCGVFICIFFL